MTVEIKYKDLIDRCEQLSSFESEGKVDAAGQSRYLEIHINEVDKLLVKQYIEQARNILEERLGRMIADVSEGQYDKIKEFDNVLENVFFTIDKSQKGKIGFFRTGRELSDVATLVPLGYFGYYTISSGVYLINPIDEFNKDSKFYCKEDGKYYELYYDETLQSNNLKDIGKGFDFKWTLRTDTRWKQNNSFAKHVSEAIVAYTMSAWLSDKLPERVAFYDTLFTNSLNLAVKNIFTKQAPV